MLMVGAVVLFYGANVLKSRFARSCTSSPNNAVPGPESSRKTLNPTRAHPLPPLDGDPGTRDAYHGSEKCFTR